MCEHGEKGPKYIINDPESTTRKSRTPLPLTLAGLALNNENERHSPDYHIEEPQAISEEE